jgi:putative ABC transport system permease protein
MWRWTLNGLIAAPLQLLSSVGAIAGAFSLVLFFQAVFAGESDQIVAYIEHSDADVWVMQKGVSNMHMASSFVWDWKARKIESVDGVSKVTPILYLNTVMVAGERRWFSFIVGLEEGDPRAGPWKMAAGQNQPGPGEAVVPVVLARLTGLGIGDQISIADREFSIVGLSEGTFSMANSVTFVAMDDLSDIMSTIGSLSYLLVDAEPGVDANALAARLRADIEKINALSRQDFTDSDWKIAMQMGLEIISVMTVIGGGLAVLLIGFTAYNHVGQRERELAVMKAMGVRDRSIYTSIMFQIGVITALAFVLANLLVVLAIPLTAWLVPQVTLRITAQALWQVGATALIVSLLASIVPVRRVVRVDPVSAFQA